MSRRKEIELTDEERQQFLAEAKTIILSSIDHRGYPHSVPMWFIVDHQGDILMTTYGKSQKAVNLRRNPRAALLVESGVTYHELKGVLIRGQARVIEDFEKVLATLKLVHQKYYGEVAGGIEEAMKAQAQKRVVIQVTPERISSWDHRKLGGGY